MLRKIICKAAAAGPRLAYTLDLLGGILSAEVEIRELSAEIQPENGVFVFEYEAGGFMPCSGLLAERGVRPQSIEMGTWEGYPVGFWQGESGKNLPFDLLAWVFYLVSRYEEYLDSPKDTHGRYKAAESIAVKHNFIRIPLVNLLAQALERHIIAAGAGWQPKDWAAGYVYRASYDIDYMFAFKNKGFFRQIMGLGRDILRLNFKEIGYKFAVWLGLRPDPFDTFDYLEQKHAQGPPPFYFFLIGDWGEYDKNIDYRRPAYQKIVARVAQHAEIGLHPSYASNQPDQTWRLATEKQRLEAIIGRPVTRSRQHFLKISFPQTYTDLLAAGIREDFSMGYAEILGFRASIATPFHWYDLQNECTTPLLVYPFPLMDVTMKNYLRLSPQQAANEWQYFQKQYQQVGGYFVSLWHNSSIGEYEGWGGWKGMPNFDCYES